MWPQFWWPAALAATETQRRYAAASTIVLLPEQQTCSTPCAAGSGALGLGMARLEHIRAPDRGAVLLDSTAQPPGKARPNRFPIAGGPRVPLSAIARGGSTTSAWLGHRAPASWWEGRDSRGAASITSVCSCRRTPPGWASREPPLRVGSTSALQNGRRSRRRSCATRRSWPATPFAAETQCRYAAASAIVVLPKQRTC